MLVFTRNTLLNKIVYDIRHLHIKKILNIKFTSLTAYTNFV